ncbi:hypothetical protein LCGC14_3058990 [marine sediment metagenome]|uniref:Uncharacterized protein n=1 Tax=marine sediment metagenome TaxID=412755 RepID=A0A0F8X7R5_9ZZZZ
MTINELNLPAEGLQTIMVLVGDKIGETLLSLVEGDPVGMKDPKLRGRLEHLHDILRALKGALPEVSDEDH